MNTVNIVVSTFEIISTFVSEIKELVNVRNARFKSQAIEFASLNPACFGKVDQFVTIRDEVKAALLDSEVGKELKAHDKKYAMTYAGHMANAMIAIFNGTDDQYIADTDIKVLSEDGLKVLETSGKKGGFLEGYKLHPARKAKLIKAGKNPETGVDMTEAEATQYKADQKQDSADDSQRVANEAQAEEDKEAKQDAALASLKLASPEHRQAVKFLRIRVESTLSQSNPATAKECKALLDEYRLILAETLGFMPTIED